MKYAVMLLLFIATTVSAEGIFIGKVVSVTCKTQSKQLLEASDDGWVRATTYRCLLSVESGGKVYSVNKLTTSTHWLGRNVSLYTHGKEVLIFEP